MPYSVSWTGSRYEARFWRSGRKDTRRIIPNNLWPVYGLKSPDEPSAKHERVALRWAAEQVTAVLQEALGREMTLAEVFALMKRENPNQVSSATLAKWACDFGNLERHGVAGAVASDVDEVIATRYRNARELDDPKPRARTIHNELAFLRQLVLFAHRWRRVTRTSAVNLVDLPEVRDEESQQVALTEAEVRKLLVTGSVFHAERNREWLVTGITTMLRRKNLLGLRGEWIDRPGGWVRIPGAEMKGRGRRDHAVPLSRVGLEVLPLVATGPLWENPATGRPYSWVDEVISGWVTRAGVRPWSLHDLRTTGNSWLQARGVDEFTRATLLGHSRAEAGTIRRSGSVTDSYTRVFEKHLIETVSIFDTIFEEIYPEGFSQESPKRTAGEPLKFRKRR